MRSAHSKVKVYEGKQTQIIFSGVFGTVKNLLQNMPWPFLAVQVDVQGPFAHVWVWLEKWLAPKATHNMKKAVRTWRHAGCANITQLHSLVHKGKAAGKARSDR